MGSTKSRIFFFLSIKALFFHIDKSEHLTIITPHVESLKYIIQGITNAYRKMLEKPDVNSLVWCDVFQLSYDVILAVIETTVLHMACKFLSSSGLTICHQS